MKRKVPITVAIPAYDAARHLPGAIETVRAQSVDVDEIVVVDDGSHDDGAAIARSLGATVIRQVNAGCGPARNTAVRHARSPWIAFLDADDRWTPEKLERQWSARALDPQVRLISSDYARYRGERLECGSVFAETPNYARTPKVRLAPDVAEISSAALAASLPLGQFLAPSTILVERALVIDDTFFSPSLSGPLYHVSEDIEWYLRALRKTDAIVVERPLMQYAVGAPSLSSSAGRMHYGLLKLAEMIEADRDRYVAGSVAAFRRDRDRREFLTVRAFLRALDTGAASTSLDDFRTRRRSPGLGALRLATEAAKLPPVRSALAALFAFARARSR